MGLDIGDAVAEAGNDRGSIGFVVDAAAHEIDGDVDRLHDDALARSECVIERSQRGEFKKACDGAAVEIAGAADDLLSERHDPDEFAAVAAAHAEARSEEHTPEPQSLLRIS